MCTDNKILFTPLKLKNITLPNRFIRSATYEGAGNNTELITNLSKIYCTLAGSGVGTIITGFCYISQQGRAMQPKQSGIDHDKYTEQWKHLVEKVKKTNPKTKLFMQIAHSGRQTLNSITKERVVGASSKKCTYFKQKTKTLQTNEIEVIISQFANAALRAKQAGFDGIQIHAAHGYLIHQFLSHDTNQRKDKFSNRNLLILEILKAVKNKCGKTFPIFIKLSHSDDKKLTITQTIDTIKSIENYIDATEISYGTMEFALNIFRGDFPIDAILKINPLINNKPKLLQWFWKKLYINTYKKRLKPFEKNYNLDASIKISQNTNTPIIPVGGIRTLQDMIEIIKNKKLAAISLCRPLICEPDLPQKIRKNNWLKSKCNNCNLCAIHCDSNNTLRCYREN